MFNVCPACGEYSVDKAIDPRGPDAICPRCGYAHRFRRQPLFIVTGASGSGKTATCLALVAAEPPCVVLETDVLWRPEFDTPADGYRTFRSLWLRLAKDIGQSGRPVALFGTALPEQIEPLPERRYFSAVHYLALVCDDDTLLARLRGRPRWRETDAPAFLEAMLRLNRWLKAAASTDADLTLVDTSRGSLEQSVAAIATWIRQRQSQVEERP